MFIQMYLAIMAAGFSFMLYEELWKRYKDRKWHKRESAKERSYREYQERS